LAEGMPPAIAEAIRDHYKPLGPKDEVPSAPLSTAVALADKLDTLIGFISVELLPTGSKDPFALRRASLGMIRIIVENRLRIGLAALCRRHSLQFFKVGEDFPELRPDEKIFAEQSAQREFLASLDPMAEYA